MFIDAIFLWSLQDDYKAWHVISAVVCHLSESPGIQADPPPPEGVADDCTDQCDAFGP